MITLNKLRVLSESANYYDSDFIPGIGFDDLQDFDESAFTFNDFDVEDSINESIGSEIWRRIKAAFHAIKKFFVMIGNKIKNFFLGFFKKNDKELEDFIKSDLDNKAKNATDPEKVVNEIKKEAGEAIKKRHDEFKKRVEDFNDNIKKGAEENKKTAESIDKSFEDLDKMLNALDGSFKEDLDRIKNIGNYCEKVKQKNPKLAKDILDILEGKEPEIKKAAANQKKQYSGTIDLYTYKRDSLDKMDIIMRSTRALGALAYDTGFVSVTKGSVILNIFSNDFSDYVSKIISGKSADKPTDDTRLNEIKDTIDKMCSANINKTNKDFLFELGLDLRDKSIYGVEYVPIGIGTKSVEVKSIKNTIQVAKGINGAFKGAIKPMQDSFTKAETEVNRIISKLDSYAKDPNSGEYAEIIKKQAQACNKIVGIIQFASSAYCNAFVSLSRENTQRIKAFADGGYKEYEVKHK